VPSTCCKEHILICCNYRPVSLTYIVVKVMERIILSAALESSNLFSEAKHGFRNKRSTFTLLLSSVNDWAAALERRNSVHCLLLDLAKAFDSVPHCRLLKALAYMEASYHGLNHF